MINVVETQQVRFTPDGLIHIASLPAPEIPGVGKFSTRADFVLRDISQEDGYTISENARRRPSCQVRTPSSLAVLLSMRRCVTPCALPSPSWDIWKPIYTACTCRSSRP